MHAWVWLVALGQALPRAPKGIDAVFEQVGAVAGCCGWVLWLGAGCWVWTGATPCSLGQRAFRRRHLAGAAGVDPDCLTERGAKRPGRRDGEGLGVTGVAQVWVGNQLNVDGGPRLERDGLERVEEHLARPGGGKGKKEGEQDEQGEEEVESDTTSD